MSKVIRISDSIFHQLQALAEPLVDTPARVIKRLLDSHQADHAAAPARVTQVGPVTMFQNDPANRASRERGTAVKLDGTLIQAGSVSDLYEQVMRYLVSNGHMKQLESILPIATSRKRYLLARQATHPNGNSFVVPVEYQRFFMEAHKDYKNAINHLRSKILDRCGIRFEYMA